MAETELSVTFQAMLGSPYWEYRHFKVKKMVSKKKQIKI